MRNLARPQGIIGLSEAGKSNSQIANELGVSLRMVEITLNPYPPSDYHANYIAYHGPRWFDLALTTEEQPPISEILPTGGVYLLGQAQGATWSYYIGESQNVALRLGEHRQNPMYCNRNMRNPRGVLLAVIDDHLRRVWVEKRFMLAARHIGLPINNTDVPYIIEPSDLPPEKLEAEISRLSAAVALLHSTQVPVTVN